LRYSSLPRVPCIRSRINRRQLPEPRPASSQWGYPAESDSRIPTPGWRGGSITESYLPRQSSAITALWSQSRGYVRYLPCRLGDLDAVVVIEILLKEIGSAAAGVITFNVSSFMGMIMVIGIVAKNGILLLDADDRLRTLGLSAADAMLQASRRRLRPIVMTALATVAGMLPLAFAIGAGSQMLQPLAIAVIGGIIVSMVLSLILPPSIHYFLSPK
jgi:hypothetical protein